MPTTTKAGKTAKSRARNAKAAQAPGGAAKAARGAAKAGPRARVRVYRHGLGDCILVRIARTGRARDYHILIDCGVILGTPDPATLMSKVVADVAKETGGEIDLLVATHEHWDHLSGFLQAAAAFARLKIGAVWMGWTEDPRDGDAQRLGAQREKALAAQRLCASRLQLAGAPEAAPVVGILEFFGAAGGTTRDALEAVRKIASPRYCDPRDAPTPIESSGARIFVLGPPRDLKLIHRSNPSRSAPETYLSARAFLPAMSDALNGLEDTSPFATLNSIPTRLAKGMDFFQQRYWKAADEDAWRRIDTAWLGAARELALKLDSATNNTSLVLAIELQGGDVLLFAADAQVGNWLSWQDLTWQVEGRTVTGPDLLRRTVFYKVGHHGSHNATLREKGLDQMENLRTAIIPVDHEMAVKKRWGNMPLPRLIAALEAKVGAGVLRTDEEPKRKQAGVKVDPLWFEVEV